MYKQINLLNGEKYYMEAERFAKRGNLISKLSSNMFFANGRILPIWIHYWYARIFGYFWLPCPICGKMFGGHVLSRIIENTERLNHA